MPNRYLIILEGLPHEKKRERIGCACDFEIFYNESHYKHLDERLFSPFKSLGADLACTAYLNLKNSLFKVTKTQSLLGAAALQNPLYINM